MDDVHVDDVSGVPAFWVNSPRPTLTGSLIFRRGMVDETLPTTGWTHLLEHIALHGRGDGPLQVNGSVSLLHTRFDVHGPPDQVAATLAAISGWLANPDLATLTHEQSILRAEADLRRGNETSNALVQRFGPNGPGLSGYTEPGLSRADPAALRELAATWFTAGNAAMFLDGPPPPNLRLHLPAGELHRAPAATPCPDTNRAAYLIRAGITLSGLTARSDAATLLPHILRERLTDQFREKAGGAYAPWAHYEPVDDDTSLLLCGSDANTELLRTVAKIGMGVIDSVAGGNLEPGQLENVRAQVLQAAADPYSRVTLAYRAAADHLRGQGPLAHQQVMDDIVAVTCDDVVAAAAAVRDTLLVGIAEKAAWDRPVPMLRAPVDSTMISGHGYRSKSYPAHRNTLRVGAEGIQHGEKGSYRTIRVDDVAGMFAYPDGGRQVIDSQGWSLPLEPTLWAHGDQAVRMLDLAVPPRLHIPMPERDTAQIPQPLTKAGQVRHFARVAAHERRELLTLCGGLALLLLAMAISRNALLPIVLATYAVYVVRTRRNSLPRRWPAPNAAAQPPAGEPEPELTTME